MVLGISVTAYGISDADLIKEALEFCNEELDGFDGPEYSDDAGVCCQRSNTLIRELIARVSRAGGKPPQDMSLNELFDHVVIVNDAIRAALANHPGFVRDPARR